VRILIDESLSGQVAELLAAAGHDVRHVRDLDLLGAPDTAVMKAADDEARVLISADTDFGELLALNRHPGPERHHPSSLPAPPDRTG